MSCMHGCPYSRGGLVHQTRPDGVPPPPPARLAAVDEARLRRVPLPQRLVQLALAHHRVLQPAQARPAYIMYMYACTTHRICAARKLQGGLCAQTRCSVLSRTATVTVQRMAGQDDVALTAPSACIQALCCSGPGLTAQHSVHSLSPRWASGPHRTRARTSHTCGTTGTHSSPPARHMLHLVLHWAVCTILYYRCASKRPTQAWSQRKAHKSVVGVAVHG